MGGGGGCLICGGMTARLSISTNLNVCSNLDRVKILLTNQLMCHMMCVYIEYRISYLQFQACTVLDSLPGHFCLRFEGPSALLKKIRSGNEARTVQTQSHTIQTQYLCSCLHHESSTSRVQHRHWTFFSV